MSPTTISKVQDIHDCPSEFLCTEDDVLDLLLSLDTTKASGPDEISTLMLNCAALSIAKGVTFYLMSIKLGKVLTEWKTSAIIYIPKGDNLNQPSNYRSISLLLILSKLLERPMSKHLFEAHRNSYMPLALQQREFRSGRSTISALLDVMHNWLQSMDMGKEVCAVFFNLRKAFDSVIVRKAQTNRNK